MTSLDVSDHEILVGSGDKHVRNYDIRMGSLGQFIFKKFLILTNLYAVKCLPSKLRE